MDDDVRGRLREAGDVGSALPLYDRAVARDFLRRCLFGDARFFFRLKAGVLNFFTLISSSADGYVRCF